MLSDKQRFNLHLPGLLKVLAEHLYSTKKVGVRELIQNAHDSCIRRRIEEGNPNYRPRISLRTTAKTLLIQDNGTGLTADEITNYLATIGRGYTRELRERLSFDSPNEASELIGQFGLGFLSAFLLASEVTVVTRSFKGGPSLRWHSAGGEFYEITEVGEVEVGTTVELKIKPAATFILQEKQLAESVRTYADFLPIPIYVQDDPDPINLGEPPWENDDPEEAIQDYISRAFHTSDPLFVLPLHDEKIQTADGSITIPLKGFLFVPPGSVASVREYGDLNVYIRNMFICDREKDLLPSWARFVRGVIDCPVLQPTASREGIHQDENFESVHQAITKQLGEGLQNLARERPDVWKTIVKRHTDVIIGWAVKDHEFYKRVENIVTFRTTRGPLSLPEYLELSGGSIYYVTRELGSLQEKLLAEGRDVPAIDAAWFSVTPFLEKYASRHPNVELVQLDGSAEEILRPVNDTPFANILAFYEVHGIKARVASFKPSEIPVMMIYPEGAEFVKEVDNANQTGELPTALDGLIQAFIAQKYGKKDDLQGTLYLNASCPMIRRLAQSPVGGRESVLTLLHQMAILFCGRMLNVTEAVGAFRDMTKSLEELIQK